VAAEPISVPDAAEDEPKTDRLAGTNNPMEVFGFVGFEPTVGCNQNFERKI